MAKFLIDNENDNLKVHEWISKYTCEGKMNMVTGYFTVGALVWLSKQTNHLIDEYRFILGDFVSYSESKMRAVNLLSENITVEGALNLSKLAKEAVEYLEQEKVIAKTVEPNFCHAKLTIFHPIDNDARHNYYISGSSNLTEAGIGLKLTKNVELNVAGTGASHPYYEEFANWFEELWKKPQTHKTKTIVNDKGERVKVDFKQYLIDEIKKLFILYTPKELYYKVLFELFGEDILIDSDNKEFNRQIGRLENTEIYKSLYFFQQKGVLSLIKMLNKYNGSILADAVGLGKTWTALAVMKYYQMQGRDIILICPKKLENNWKKYQKKQMSRFEPDLLDYSIMFHSDLLAERITDLNHIDYRFLTSERPKLIVIDESHNLRNDKSQRYKCLIENVLKKNADVKVLLLSATPINNSLLDIRNQFKLFVGGNIHGFSESLDVRNIDATFRLAKKAFNEWIENPQPKIGDLIKKLDSNFFKLTDSLTVARTRKMISNHNTDLYFPKKAKPLNLFITPKQIGNFENFEELIEHFPPMLSGYQPAFYAESFIDKRKKLEAKMKGEKRDTSILEDEQQRDQFLVKMIYILMVKRLESSWKSFQSTVEFIYNHHQNALTRIITYEKTKQDKQLTIDTPEDEGEELDRLLDSFTLGKKRKVKLSDIDEAGMMKYYKRDLKKDIDALDTLKTNIARFEEKIDNELKLPSNFKSVDDKLEALIDQINKKQKRDNKKVLIFTVFTDTANYLFEQLKQRGFTNLATVNGQYAKTWDDETESKLFEPVLERFAPFTKLFMEREWKSFVPSRSDLTKIAQYNEWQSWIADIDKRTSNKLHHPIDILIATDVLSEGQNLQDCDLVINYDIHWNPVRVIQRMGRIDRLGSPNEKVHGINFWPSNNIESYLNLKGRIEQRMAAMQLAGSEVNTEFTDSFKEMAEDEKLEEKQNSRMLKQMQTTWDDIEEQAQSLGFDDLSLEIYRQELAEELRKNQKIYSEMPLGIFTGFKKIKDSCPLPGLIALLGYPARSLKLAEGYKSYELIYIDNTGNPVKLNQKEILESLSNHQNEPRFVDQLIEHGDPVELAKLVAAIDVWLNNQARGEEMLDDGTSKKTIGKQSLNILDKLKAGSKKAVDDLKTEEPVSEKYQKDKFDLITWFIIS
jgi:ERCC4-related helicase